MLLFATLLPRLGTCQVAHGLNGGTLSRVELPGSLGRGILGIIRSRVSRHDSYDLTGVVKVREKRLTRTTGFYRLPASTASSAMTHKAQLLRNAFE